MKLRSILFLLMVFFAPGAKGQGCIENVPYIENFDGSSWGPKNSWISSGSVPACWTPTPTSGNYLWVPGPIFWNNPNTGPSADHTTGSGKYMVADAVFLGTTQRYATNLITPPIDISTLSYPRLSFFHHMYGGDINKLDVRVRKYGTTGWTLLANIPSNSTVFTTQNSDWILHKDSLMGFVGDTIQIMFTAVRTVNNNWNSASRIAIDDIVVEETPTCDVPYNLTNSLRTFNSIKLNWNSNNSNPLAIQVQYSIGTGTPTFGTLQSLANNGAVLQGLSPNTTYTARIREICAVGDTSAWSNTTTFTTHCAPAIAPWSEDFESSVWNPSSIWNQVGDIDPCWVNQSNSSQFWNIGPPVFSWLQTGPNGDHTTGSGQYLYQATTSALAQSSKPRIFTKWIDLDTLGNPELRFYYHAFGQNMGTLKVYAQNFSGSNSLLLTRTGGTHSSSTAVWTEESLPLSNFINDTIRIWFEYDYGTGNVSTLNQFAIDDILIDNVPSCPKPSATLVSQVGIYVANLQWTSGGASNYQIRYRPKGTSVWSWASANQAQKSIGGLLAATNYEWEVRDSCGSGNVSAWFPGPGFKTNCTIVTAPFIEEFSDQVEWVSPIWPDQNGEIQDCWVRTDSTDYFWSGAQDAFNHYPNTGPSADHTNGSGGYAFARSAAPFSSTANTTLRTPVINLDTLHSPVLSFWYHMFGSEIEKLEVYLWSKANNSLTKIVTLNGEQQASASAAWKQKQVNLTAYEGDTIQLEFKASRNGSGFGTAFRAAIAIDDITIDETTSCPTPLVAAANITYNSADINWTGISNNTAYEYGLLGFTSGMGTTVGTTSNNAQLTGLDPNTAYTVRVKDTCTTSLVSQWGAVNFTTLPCPAITASGTIINNALIVNGLDATTDADSVLWLWGDGQSDTGSTVNHVYSTFGTFTINQIVFNDCGSSDTLIHNLSVCDTIDVHLTYTSNFTTVSMDTSGTQGTALTFSYDFGDGNSSTQAQPSHTYSSDGTYNITVVSTDACGQTDTAVLTVVVCEAVNLGFSQSALGNTFTLVANNANLQNYSWDFGDGNTGTGSSVVHTFAGNGSFNVVLTAEDDCGNVYTVSQVVTTCDAPTGDFSFFIVSTSSNGMTVQFTANAPNATKFYWYWGDGTSNFSTTTSVQHLYPVVQLNYLVTLLMMNDCGDTVSVTHRLSEVGIAEFDLGVQLYPNPAIDQTTIEFLQPYTGAVQLYTAEGRRLGQWELRGDQRLDIDVSSFAPGVYVLEFTGEAQRGRTTFVIQ